MTAPAAAPVSATRVATWESIAALGVARSHLSAAVAGGAIYAIGGNEHGVLAASDAVERYEPTTDRWERASKLPTPTDHAAVASVGSAIFVFGGNFGSPRATAHRYDTSSDRWSPITALPEPRAAGGAAAFGSQVYVMGGFGVGRRLLGTAYAYDPAVDRWDRIPDLPTPREHVAVVAYRGFVCALGGHFGSADQTDVVECYDPTTRRWSSPPPLARRASDFDAVVVGDQIWTIGDDVQIFDGVAWRLGPRLGIPRFGLAAAVMDGAVYAIGGAARSPTPPGIVERIRVR